MTFKFPSLGMAKERVYRVNTDAIWGSNAYRVPHALCPWLYFYDTLGDGTTAHTPDHVVLDHDMPDALGSLAVFLTDMHASNPVEYRRLADSIRTHFPEPLDRKRVEFAASVRYKEGLATTTNPGKRQYYSLDAQKVSAVDSKRFDKRWQEVPSWADGAPENVVGVLLQGVDRTMFTLDSISIYYDVYHVYQGEEHSTYGSHYQIPTKLKLVDDYSAGWPYMDAFLALRAILELARTEYTIERQALNLRRTLAPAAEEVAK